MTWIAQHLSGSLNAATSGMTDAICDVGDGVVVASEDWDYSTGTLVKLSYAGVQLWQKTLPSFVVGMGADSSGNVYVLDGVRVTKLSGSDGSTTWQKTTSTGFTGAYYCALAVYPNGDCFVSSGNTDPLLYVARFDSSGALTYEKTYTGITDEVATGHKWVGKASDGSLYVAGHNTGGSTYLKLTKLSSAFAETWSKSYANASHSLSTRSACILANDNVVVSALASASLGTLRLFCVQPDGAVVWSKSITDSAIASFHTNYTTTVRSLSTGFSVHGKDDSGRGIAYVFDNDGALSFARAFTNPASQTENGNYGLVSTSDGGFLLGFTPNDDSANYVPTFVKVTNSGELLGAFGADIVVSSVTTASVATGITYTVGSPTAGTVAATAGTGSTSSETLTTTTYVLTVSEGPDPKTYQATGIADATHHGTPTATYDQSFTATGYLVTAHGTPIYYTTPLDTTAYFASGSFYTNHGTPTASLDFSGQVSGPLVTTHGTPEVTLDFAATTGGVVTTHGTPALSDVFSAEGLFATLHGTPSLEFVVYAAGNLVTNHGTPVLTLAGEYVATGSLVTNHGTPVYGGSYFSARSTPPSLRHGKPLLVRTPTC